MEFLEMKKREVLEKLELEKVPENYRGIFKFLLKKHCCKFSDLLLNKNCKIRSCKVYENAEDFFNKYNIGFVKLQKKIYRFEVWDCDLDPFNTNHSKVWMTSLYPLYCKECFSKETDFTLGRLCIICYYGSIKKGIHILIYNGFSKTDFDELLNNPDKLI